MARQGAPRRYPRVAALATVVLVLAAGWGYQPAASAGDSNRQVEVSLARFQSQPLSWVTCPGQPAAPDGSTRVLRCATIRVPLDYSAPKGRTIAFTLSRLPAADQHHKKGTMVVFPGGPGVPGLTYPLAVDALDGGRIGQVYDLVGFDNRGVGASTPVSCRLSTPQKLYNFYQLPSPEGIEPSARMAKSISDTCQANAGEYLRHVNTTNLARDLEVLRRALRLPAFAYLSSDFGSTLLLNYMGQFPRRVSKAVFDTLPDFTVPVQQADLNSAHAMANRFTAIAAALAANDVVYRLGATPQAVQQTWLEKVAELHARPQQLAGVTVDGYLLRLIKTLAMYEDRNVPLFGTVLSALVNHDNEEQAAQIVQAMNIMPVLLSDELHASQFLIGCTQSPWDRDIRNYERRVAEYSRLYPVDGGALANISTCAFWPIPPGPRLTVDRHGPRNILILHNTIDPFYSHEGAVAARNALSNRARMVSVQVGGTHVLPTGLQCPVDIMHQFLIEDSLPDDDVTC
jgi:pimeloyl-ACP methyl ester carboxylesterase